MLHDLLKKYKSFPVQVKASLWFLVCSFMQKGVAVITTPIFTRIMTTVEFGQYNVFSSWMGILTVFVSLNLTAGVFTQGIVKFEENRAKFVSSLQGLTMVLVAIWTIVYMLASKFWNRLFSLTTVEMLVMLALIWMTAIFNFWAAEQRVKYKYRTLVILTIVVSVLQPCVSVFFVLQAKNKVLARILGMLLVDIIAYFGLFIVHVCKGKQLYDSFYWKYALRFNLPLIPHYLSLTVLNSADRIMIERIVGEGKAGIYSLAYSISMVMTLFNTALMSTISPWIYQKIKIKKVKDIEHIAYISLVGIAGVNLLLIFLAPEIVRLFAPVEYYEAIWIIPPVAMSAYFMYSYDLFAKFQFYYEKTEYVMLASICGAILNVILNSIFIPQFGYFAAGYTTLACYILFVAAHYMFMQKVCKDYLDNVKVFDSKKIFGITTIFVGIGFTIMCTYQYMVLRYVLLIVSALIIFCHRQRILEEIRMLLYTKLKK